jgi:hypothetical protein
MGNASQNASAREDDDEYLWSQVDDLSGFELEAFDLPDTSKPMGNASQNASAREDDDEYLWSQVDDLSGLAYEAFNLP